jgi:hypothetical protein
MGLMINCKEATFLVDKAFETKIGLNAQLKLRYHLYICTVCSTYKIQSGFLNQSFKEGLNQKPDAVFVEELKEKIKLKMM